MGFSRFYFFGEFSFFLTGLYPGCTLNVVVFGMGILQLSETILRCNNPRASRNALVIFPKKVFPTTRFRLVSVMTYIAMYTQMMFRYKP